MGSRSHTLRDRRHQAAEPIHTLESRGGLHSESTQGQVAGKGVEAQLARELPLPNLESLWRLRIDSLQFGLSEE